MSLLNFLNESENKERTFDDISKLFSGKLMEIDPDIDLPITAEEGVSGWKIINNPESMIRKFKFDHVREVIFFVNELYKYSHDINHIIKILIEDLNVTVSTTTHEFNGITSQDKKIIHMSNELYSDTRYFKNND